jgi:putative sterol carrier protein
MTPSKRREDHDGEAIERFFADLSERGTEPLLKGATGTLRFDLTDGKRVDRRYVTVTKGEIAVSHRNAPADAVISADRELFERVATGRVNATAAVLRGVFEVQGDLGLLMLFQRLFPGPPRTRRRATARARA